MNKYELLEIIGEGAYGIVIKARSKETNEYVAIKKFKEKDDQEDVRRCIYRELKMLKTLRASDNIVSLKEAYRKKGNIYFVFEYVDRNMLQLLEENTSGVSQETCKNLIYQLVKAIDWCHSHEIIHRDIKPENLLISYDGKLKLCDFGFARRVSNPNENVVYTEYVATRWYRPPELLLSMSYGKPVDIWAIGAILGELCDGQPLFPGESDIDQLYLIQKVMGPLPQNQLDIMKKSPKFSNFKFPKVNDCIPLSRKYDGLITDSLLEFMETCLQLDPEKRLSIKECISHHAFRQYNNLSGDSRVQLRNKHNNSRCKKAYSFHESTFYNNNNSNNKSNGGNIVIINPNIDTNTKLKLSLNDLTNLNHLNNNSTNKIIDQKYSSNGVYNVNSNRIVNSSMSTFSPRTNNGSLNVYNEVIEEKYNRINNQNNFNGNNNNEFNKVEELATSSIDFSTHKSLSINGVSYSNAFLNGNNKTDGGVYSSTTSFQINKNNDDPNNVVKYSHNTKYTVNNYLMPSLNSKSPREKSKYSVYTSQHQQSQNFDEFDANMILRKNGYKDEQSTNDFIYSGRNTPYSVSQQYNKLNQKLTQNVYRSETKLDSNRLPGVKEISMKSYKRSKTSFDSHEDNPNGRENTNSTTQNYTNVNINNNMISNNSNNNNNNFAPIVVNTGVLSNKLSKTINHINSLNIVKLNSFSNSNIMTNNTTSSGFYGKQSNSQLTASTPMLQVINSKTKKQLELNAQQNKHQTHYQTNQNSTNVINHFDRTASQLAKKTNYNMINGSSYGNVNNPTYLLALRNKK